MPTRPSHTNDNPSVSTNRMPIEEKDQVQLYLDDDEGRDSRNSPASSASSNQSTMTDTKEIKDVAQRNLGRFRSDPVGFMYRLTSEGLLFYTGSGWRNYDDYIGQKILDPSFSMVMKKRVLDSERVRRVIRYLAEKQTLELSKTKDWRQSDKKYQAQRKRFEKEIETLAKEITEELIAGLDSRGKLRVMAFSVGNILVRLYNQGIHIQECEFLEFRKKAVYAAENKIPLLFLPCHKSHVDYLILSYTFFRLGIALPHIAAGNNLDLPGVGNLLKSCGAFFIRRSFGDDFLYNEIVKEYTILEGGYNLECFIEGTRSRTGKLLSPKFGFLKMVVEALFEGRCKDVIICPISVGYDRVIETESYVDELLGKPKERESLGKLASSTLLLQPKWGRLDVHFAKPYSLREYVDKQIARRSLEAKPFDPSHDIEDRRTLLRSFGYQNDVSVIMPTALGERLPSLSWVTNKRLVGTVVLTLRGRGVGRSELIRRVDWLRGQIVNKGGRVVDFGRTPTDEVVDKALKVLKDLIGMRKDLIECVYYAKKQYELSYYRNQVIHLFINEAIVSVAMYVKIKIGGGRTMQRVPLDQLMSDVAYLSRLLKNDFVFGPEGVHVNANHALNYLKTTNVLESEHDVVLLAEEERAIGRENYGTTGFPSFCEHAIDFYCFLLWPFVETYWLATVSMFLLASIPASRQAYAISVPDGGDTIDHTKYPMLPWVEEREFTDKVVLFGKTLYYQGDISYLESINKETLKNAWERLRQMRVLLSSRPKATGQRAMVALSPVYYPERTPSGALKSEGKLWDMVDRVGKFRREGKNRRDNATVSSRVLRLAETVGWGSRSKL